MAQIQDDILEHFLEELKRADGFSEQHVDKLRALFTLGRKPKAADFVSVLTDPSKDLV